MRVEVMWKHTLILICLSGCGLAGPLHGTKRNVPPTSVREQETVPEERSVPEPLETVYSEMPSTLTLPSNATSIRNDITDNFSCDDKVYGYYADMENDCQIFHVCLPVTYADGKENMFRWSFICPEETIFSQDSFTCMRREDMSIACEDSINFYELNRNFGMAEEEGANSNSVQSIAEQPEPQGIPAVSIPQELQQPAVPEEKPDVVSAPSPQPSKPDKEKPVKLPKPNRRKPQLKPQQIQAFQPANKQPAIVPLRKMPSIGTRVPSPKPSEAEVTLVADSGSKPIPSRYKKRPTSTLNSEKEVVEAPAPPFRIEMVYSASNPDSFKRKHPIFAHKNNVADTHLMDTVPAVETLAEQAPMTPIESTIKFEPAKEDVSPVKNDVAKIEESVAQAVEEKLVDLEQPQVISDAEPQASEVGAVIMEPESELKTKSTFLKDRETEEKLTAEKEEKKSIVHTSTDIEESVLGETAPVEKSPSVDETVAPIEVIPQIPTASLGGHEIVQSVKELQNALPENVAEPVTSIENSVEESLPTLEELEEQKPENAVESMPATSEMEHQDPIVQQAFAETDSHLQSVGGFKRVDPELAAEAEAILSNFINKLKIDQPNAEPMVDLPFEEEAPKTSAEVEGAIVEEPKQSEEKIAEEETKIATYLTDTNGNTLKTVTAEQTPVEAVVKETIVPENDSGTKDEAAKDAPLLKFPISNNFPANMYQIPVTVIQTPYEEETRVIEPVLQEAEKTDNDQTEIQDEQPQVEIQREAQSKNNEELKHIPEESQSNKEGNVERKQEVLLSATTDDLETPPETVAADDIQSEAEDVASPMSFRPISIDDIVELVKERLDQTPADEKGTPMELVMEPDNVDKPVGLKFSTQQKGTKAEKESAKQTPAEDIIFPIYHRLSDATSNDIKAPEVMAVDEPNFTATKFDNVPEKEQTLDQAAKTEAQGAKTNVDSVTATNIKTEADIAPVKEIESSTLAKEAIPIALPKPEITAKANRAFRSRSLVKAKLDPRKRRFLFKADAS